MTSDSRPIIAADNKTRIFITRPRRNANTLGDNKGRARDGPIADGGWCANSMDYLKNSASVNSHRLLGIKHHQKPLYITHWLSEFTRGRSMLEDQLKEASDNAGVDGPPETTSVSGRGADDGGPCSSYFLYNSFLYLQLYSIAAVVVFQTLPSVRPSRRAGASPLDSSLYVR
ncbi:hypothetical protein EVAR_89546_1 [Eumeta japonica]|uniref:Uncharacterized protein n=1 Tax=Eumeta variegata TaxID=151549 RepID=A0A4C1ZBM5_EUMVA|nr:hypothetical protein EVAR_89546_1 [Eumeta japonica]